MQPLSPTYRHGDQQRELCRIPASDACVCVHVWGLSHGLSHESCTTFSQKQSRTVIYNKCARVVSGCVRSDVKHVRDPTLMPRENIDPFFGTVLLFICVWVCVHKDLVIWIHFFDHVLDTSFVPMEDDIPNMHLGSTDQVQDKVFIGQCVFYHVH